MTGALFACALLHTTAPEPAPPPQPVSGTTAAIRNADSASAVADPTSQVSSTSAPPVVHNTSQRTKRTVGEALKAIGDAQAWRTELIQHRESALLEGVSRSVGTLTFSRPGRLSLHLEGHTVTLAEVDHEGIESEGTGVLSHSTQARRLATLMLTVLGGRVEAWRALFFVQPTRNKRWALTLTPRREGDHPLIQHMQVTVSPAGFFKEIEWVDGYGDRTRWQLTRPSLNASIVDEPSDILATLPK